jgi:hypothetical protein
MTSGRSARPRGAATLAFEGGRDIRMILEEVGGAGEFE